MALVWPKAFKLGITVYGNRSKPCTNFYVLKCCKFSFGHFIGCDAGFFFFIIRSMMIRSNWNWLRRLFLYMNSTCAEGKWICVVNIYMEIAIRNVTIKLTFHLDALILGENCRFMIYVNKSEKNKKKSVFCKYRKWSMKQKQREEFEQYRNRVFDGLEKAKSPLSGTKLNLICF